MFSLTGGTELAISAREMLKMEHTMIIAGQLIDIHNRKIYPAQINIKGELIDRIDQVNKAQGHYILPGLIDAHIHIESSMCTPGAFAAAAVSRGTTSVVSDPHEIANVLGIAGVKFMISDAQKVPLKFWFGAPSCVPATSFESSGAVIDHNDIEKLMEMPQIKYLAEVMNFPGVVYDDPEIHYKIKIAKSHGKPVDGHAPGLSGNDLKKYVAAGISTDHECSNMEEALEKISMGMKILIREGSAARNLNELKDLIRIHPDMVMLCSDDLHPEMLAERHINKLVARIIADGYDLFDVLRCCTVNPAKHYDLKSGLLIPGQPADFIIVNDPAEMTVLETWIEGRKVFDRGKVLFNYKNNEAINNFNCSPVSEEDIRIKRAGNKMRVIEAFDGELLTKEITVNCPPGKNIKPDIRNDILKIVVKDRYRDSPPSAGFIKGFGLRKGAFAGSVAHDSHNIISIGTNDIDIVNAINEIIKLKGGLSVTDGANMNSLPLPVAGIMSDQPVNRVAENYQELSHKVKSMGCRMSAPFMTLSFMALLVIPELKLSDQGLFDGRRFCLVDMFIS